MKHASTFRKAISLNHRGDVRTLYLALMRNEQLPEPEASVIAAQFDAGLATAKRRGGRSLTSFLDLADLLAKRGLIVQSRFPARPRQDGSLRELAEQKYRDAVAAANNPTTPVPSASHERK
jgi:hypothetical protein